MGNSDLLFNQLFKRNVSAADTTNFLTALTKEHPYFTAAQFFLLQKTAADSERYTTQAAKTALLFNNPFWLNYQSAQLNISDVLPSKTEEGFGTDEIPSSDIAPENADSSITIELNHAPANGINEASTIFQTTEADEITSSNALMISPASSVELKSIDAEESSVKKEPLIIAPAVNKTTSPFFTEDQNEGMENSEEYGEEYGEEMIDDREIEPMNIKLNFTADMSTTEETISFEPLHTSDYFASLGIKFTGDIKPDKLGRQLKSFTEWLKTMKKIHTDQLVATNEQTDIIIQKMAEQSNAEGETLTEAMAEVLFQQGKTQKAIEVYQKLSLLNPSKMAYFVAKINQIER